MCSDIPSTPREWRVRAEPIIAPDTLTCGNCGLGDQHTTLPPPTLKGNGNFLHSCPCGEVHRLTSKRLACECDELRKMVASFFPEAQVAPEHPVTHRIAAATTLRACPECGQALADDWCANCGWHPGQISLQSWQINEICSEMEAGTGRTVSLDDVRRLYETFCELVEQGQQLPHQLLKRLAIAFRAYFNGKNLEAALHLTRREGRPSAIGLHQQMALMVLELRLAGMSYREAVTRTANVPGAAREESIVKAAWAEHKREAMLELRLRRAAADQEWTSDELAQLKKIFPKDEFVGHKLP